MSKKFAVGKRTLAQLRILKEKFGELLDKEKGFVITGGACGGLCKVSCSWYCRAEEIGEEIISIPKR